jgi:hypothetical protein
LPLRTLIKHFHAYQGQKGFSDTLYGLRLALT